jgi:hypothetical protein
MAALRSHKEAALKDADIAHDGNMGAAAVIKFIIFATDDKTFEDWVKGEPGTLPLLEDGEKLAPILTRLKTGDTGTLDPAKYFYTGLSFPNFPFLRSLGSENLGFFVGCYAGASHQKGTLLDKHLEALRYEKRGVLAFVRELPAYIPGAGGKFYWWVKAMLTGVRNTSKSGLGYYVEKSTGGEIAWRNRVLDATFGTEKRIRDVVLPPVDDIAQMPLMQLYDPAVHKAEHMTDQLAYKDFDNAVKNARDEGYNIREQWSPRRQRNPAQ